MCGGESNGTVIRGRNRPYFRTCAVEATTKRRKAKRICCVEVIHVFKESGGKSRVNINGNGLL